MGGHGSEKGSVLMGLVMAHAPCKWTRRCRRLPHAVTGKRNYCTLDNSY